MTCTRGAADAYDIIPHGGLGNSEEGSDVERIPRLGLVIGGGDSTPRTSSAALWALRGPPLE